jgi:hypothetical protein
MYFCVLMTVLAQADRHTVPHAHKLSTAGLLAVIDAAAIWSANKL